MDGNLQFQKAVAQQQLGEVDVANAVGVPGPVAALERVVQSAPT